MTRISVAVCTCNREKLVAETLSAIAGQTRPPDELVIGDDCSEDGTRKVIEAFALRAAFPVRLHVNEVREGNAANYSRTIERTTGDIIALCDDDDVWLPDKLEVQAAALSRVDGPLLSFTDAEIVDERLEPQRRAFFQIERFAAEQPVPTLFATQLRTNLATTSTIAFRAELKRLALPIPRIWVQDWWLASIAAALDRVHWVNRPLVKYRQHPGAKRGAKERGMAQQWRKGRSDNLREYQIQLAQAEELRERLEQLGVLPQNHAYLKLIADRIAHLGHRIQIRSSNRAERMLLVGRELLLGNYHNYSLGLRSALKDALF